MFSGGIFISKILLTSFWILCSFLVCISTTFAHRWEFICSDNQQSIYIDIESVMEFNSIVSFGKPHFQALFKNGDGILMLCSFSMVDGTKFIYPMIIESNVEKILELKSTSQQQENYYDQMLDTGLSPRLARIAANQKLNEFRENISSKLTDALSNYGLNSDNTINPIGMNLLYKLMSENPTMVSYYLNNFRISTNFVVIPDNSPALKFYDVAFRYSLKTIRNNF